MQVTPPLSLLAPAAPADAQPDVTMSITSDDPPTNLEGAVERFATAPLGETGEPGFRFFDLPDRAVIRITGTGDVHVTDDTITLHLTEPSHAYLGGIVLPGMALALWLERRGVTTLHGAAASVDGAGVAFLATRGTGKSSIAAHLALSGDPLLTEDLLVLSQRRGVPHVEPGLAQLRLWPEQAARIVEDWEQLEQPHPGFSKRRLAVGSGGVGDLARWAVPLRRIYVLERSIHADYPLRILPMSGASAILELLVHSYLAEVARGFGWQARRLRSLSELLTNVPVRRLRIPNDRDRLDEVRARICDDLVESSSD